MCVFVSAKHSSVSHFRCRKRCYDLKRAYETELKQLCDERLKVGELLEARYPRLVSSVHKLNAIEEKLVEQKTLQKLYEFNDAIEVNLKEHDWLNVREKYLQLRAFTKHHQSECSSSSNICDSLLSIWNSKLNDYLEEECSQLLERISWPFDVPRDMSPHRPEMQTIRILLDIFNLVLTQNKQPVMFLKQ